MENAFVRKGLGIGKCVQLALLESTVLTAKGLIEIMYFGYNNALPQNAHFLKFVEQVYPYQL